MVSTKTLHLDSLKKRVRFLIDLKDGGSVNAAAKRSDIPQATLARLADGRTERPRSDVVQKVAKAFDVSTDWLLSGEGAGPHSNSSISDPRESRFAAAFEWQQIVRSLGLERLHAEMLMEFPRTMMSALYDVVIETPLMPHPKSAKVSESDELLDAVKKERNAWVQLFREWIRQAGVDAVRKQLLAHKEDFARRFVTSYLESPTAILTAQERRMVAELENRSPLDEYEHALSEISLGVPMDRETLDAVKKQSGMAERKKRQQSSPRARVRR